MIVNVVLPLWILFFFLIWIFKCLNIMRGYERAVVFRLGRVLKKEKGPGIVLILWPIDKIVQVSLRVVTWEMPPQDIITRDMKDTSQIPAVAEPFFLAYNARVLFSQVMKCAELGRRRSWNREGGQGARQSRLRLTL